MTITATVTRNAYSASAGQTLFNYTFPITHASELQVYYGGILLTLGVHYNVAGVGDPGGNVVLTSGAQAGVIVIILGNLPLSQNLDYTDHGPFPAAAHEGALDKLTRLAQQHQEMLQRSVLLRPASTVPEFLGPLTLADPDAGKYLVWSADGRTLEPVAVAPNPGTTTYQATGAGAVVRPLSDKLSDWLSARDYGFSPTNTAAGNTAAWANLMAAIPATGATVVIPPGTYLHNGLVMTGKRNVALMGFSGLSGTAHTKLVCIVASVDSLLMVDCSGTRLDGFWAGHSLNSDANTFAIKAYGYFDLHMNHISTWRIEPEPGSWGGLCLQGSPSTDSFQSWIHHCEFVNHAGHGVLIFGLDAGHRAIETTISDSVIVSCDGSGVAVGDWVAGVYLRSGTSIHGNGRNVDIATTVLDGRTLDIFVGPGCILDAPVHENIRGQNTHSVHILGNWICSAGVNSLNVVWGIDQLTAGAAAWEIKDNYLVGNRGGGIRTAGAHSHIHDNFLQANGLGAGTPTGLLLTATSAGNNYGGNKFLTHAADVSDLGANCAGVNYNETDPRPIARSGMAWSDTNFFAQAVSGVPTIAFDPTDALAYVRTTNQYVFSVASVAQLAIQPGAAGESPLWLFDASTGTLKRVSFGANDSGGAGFKALRVAN